MLNRKDFMKKIRLKKWVKNTLTVIALVGALFVLRATQKAFVETCVEQGYSTDYCIAHS